MKATLCVTLYILLSLRSFAGEIAITIDDLPYVMPSRVSPSEGAAQVQAINRALQKYSIEATGFVIGAQVNWRSKRALRIFTQAGHSVGNHSWAHQDQTTLATPEFQEVTRRTDRRLGKWMDGQKYYRFPYLREGAGKTRKAALEALRELGYENAPVTIDNQDWKFNADYMDALEARDAARAEEIAEAYLAHMKSQTARFQRLAQDAFGRDVKHVLLLHLNQINADHLEHLLDWYAEEGWQFVPLQEALSDPVFDAPSRYTGNRGVSHLERVSGRLLD
jgi:peptidoglycan/xylan/chitin deacetylase (PgdA/CDA1 family)